MSRILGNELMPKLVDRINSREFVSVVATSSENIPNTAPISFIYALNERILRMVVFNEHTTLRNIMHNPHISMSLIGEHNTAVSIGGIAKVICDINNEFSLVEIEITSVKSDRSPHCEITHGAAIRVNDESLGIINNIFEQIKK